MVYLFTPTKYINFDWSDGSKQRELRDYILQHKSEYDLTKDFATFRGYPLMAMAPYFATTSKSDVGKIIEITYLINASSGSTATESFEVVIVDIKGDESLNYSQSKNYDNVGSYDVKTGKHAGHYMFDSYMICITEMVGTTGESGVFSTQFNKHYSANSRVIKVKDTGKTIYDIK